MRGSQTGSEMQRWGAARRNAHDLSATVDALERTLADAVYLDADAYHTHSLLQQYKEAVRVRAWQTLCVRERGRAGGGVCV